MFYFVFEGNFQVKAPQGTYIRRGDLTEGFWGAYIWRGLFSEFYGMTLQRLSQNQPKRSLWGFSVLRHSKQWKRHYYPTIPRGPCSSKSSFLFGILTAYVDCKYFPLYTRKLLRCGGNDIMISWSDITISGMIS